MAILKEQYVMNNFPFKLKRSMAACCQGLLGKSPSTADTGLPIFRYLWSCQATTCYYVHKVGIWYSKVSNMYADQNFVLEKSLV